VEPNVYAEPTHTNCSPFNSRTIVGKAAPIEVYDIFCVKCMRPFRRRPTNSTAVTRTESARENMMHQNFQSFGTPMSPSTVSVTAELGSLRDNEELPGDDSMKREVKLGG
jgi:hypothetical protein